MLSKLIPLGLMILLASVAQAELTDRLDIEDHDHYTAQVVLTPHTRAVLSSQISGFIKKLPFREGDSFKKDDVLIEFDCTVHESNYKKAQATVNSSKAMYEANLKLKKLNAISSVELAQSESQYDENRADLRIRKHTVKLCKVVAPFDGKVVQRKVNQFESVQHGQPLIEILDSTELDVEVIVPSSWLSWLKVGDKFTVRLAENEKDYPAKILKILPRIDAVSQSVQLLGTIEGVHSGQVAGMSGQAIFDTVKSELDEQTGDL